jgi:hypothetical protein
LECRRQVVEDVRALQGIAAVMRRVRYENGALRLDNVKLNFDLDSDGNPCAAHPHGGLALTELVAVPKP